MIAIPAPADDLTNCLTALAFAAWLLVVLLIARECERRRKK